MCHEKTLWYTGIISGREVTERGKYPFFFGKYSGQAPEKWLRLIIPTTLDFCMGRQSSSTARDHGGSIAGTPPVFLLCRFLLIAAIFSTLVLACAAAQEGPDGNSSLVNAPAAANQSTGASLNETNATAMKDSAYQLVNKGIGCAYSNNYACVVASFDAAHQALPEDIVVLYDYAVALAIMKKYDEAAVRIDAAIALDPENPRLWSTRGAILKAAGDYAGSGRSYERAEELDPAFKVSFFDRYPMNLILVTVLKNTSIIVLLAGFALLGIYIWFNEKRHKN